MANACCSPCFWLDNENAIASEETASLREMVKKLEERRNFDFLVSYIEDSLKDIVSANPPRKMRGTGDDVSGAEGDSIDVVKSSTDLGRALVQYVMIKTCARKVSSLEKLGHDVRKVVSAVLNEAPMSRWMTVGLSVVAHMMDEMRKDSAKRSVHLQYLLYMLGLLKYFMQRPNHLEAEQKMLKDAVDFIALGSLLCIIRMQSADFCGFLTFSGSANKAYLDNLEFQFGYTHPELRLGEILRKFSSIVPQSTEQQYTDAGAVSIEEARDEVFRLLDINNDSRLRIMVVVHGQDGIGKTTVANEVFDLCQRRLTNHEFFRFEIKHRSSVHDMKILQQQLLRDLFGKIIALRSCVEGRAHLSNAFREASRPVFIFIDNVQRDSDMDNLLPGEAEWLPIQSRVLVTSRHPPQFSISEHIEQSRYSMKGLHGVQGKSLLCKQVLRNTEATFSPKVNIDNLTNSCKGLPLALRMVASYLRQNDDHFWACEHLLQHMKNSPAAEINICFSLVDFIFKRLEEAYKEAFLDIAIFFNDWERHKLVYIFSDLQVGVLEEAGLVIFTPEGKVLVHDVVRERAIILSGKARITDGQQLKDALRHELNLSEIKGIWLSERESEFILEARQLDWLHKTLRVLYLGKSIKISGECKTIFEEVRFFYIHNKHYLSTDLHNFKRLAFFHGNLKKEIDFLDSIQSFQLLGLDVVSGLTNLSRGLQLAMSLHVVELSESPDLDRLPQGFNFFSSLEELDLSNCVNLKDLPVQLGQFKSLCKLKLTACSSIKALPETLGDLSFLEEMDCADCSNLVGLPASFGQLKSLYYLQLRGCCQLLSLPESFGNLSSLEELDLRSCKKMKSLPDSFIKLKSLFHVHLQGCSELKTNISLVGNIGDLSSMEEFDLSGCENLSILPDSFSQLKSLRVLKLCCSNLTELPVSTGTMSSLQRPSLTNCERLAKLANSLSQLKSLYRMHLEGCSEITEIPLPPLKELEIRGCRKLIKLPDNIEQHQDSLRVLKLQGCSTLSELPPMFGKLPSLEVLVLNDCKSLKALPPSFSQLKSLRHLRLRGASGITSESVAVFPTSLETLDLSQCSSLKSLPEGFANSKNMTSLLLDGCSKLSALPDDFGGLNSLRYLSIAGCTQLKALPNHFEDLSSLQAINASGCSALRGEEMKALAGMKRLIFADVRESPKLAEQWARTHQSAMLVMRSETEPEATMYADMLRRYDPVVWLTMCDPGPDEHSPAIRREISQVPDTFVRFEFWQPDPVRVLMLRDTEGMPAKGGKEPLACACAMFGLWKLTDPELFNTLATLRTVLVGISTPEKGKVEMNAILPAFPNGRLQDDDVERWIDPKGGFARIVSPFLHFVSESIGQGKEPIHQSTN